MPGADPHDASSAARRGQWLVVLVAWTAIVLLAISRTWFELRFFEGEVPVGRAIAWSFIIWLFWLAAAPLILAAAERWPIRRRDLRSRLALHLAFALTTVLLHSFWAVLVSMLLRPFPMMREMTFGAGLAYFLSVNLISELALYGAVLGGGLAHRAVRTVRERERQAARLELKLGEARLAALKAQIQPHFFFNSLNTVSMMVRNGERDGAVKVIADLGDLLRYALASGARQSVPLAEEVDFVRHYLEVERARFADRLEVEIDVPSPLLGCEVPSLVLQPLVENAVRHGVGRSSGAARVRLAARLVEDHLELTVEDDGPGLPSGFVLAHDAGVGLENTRDRLSELYGDAASLTLTGRGAGGAVATVAVPYSDTALEE